MSTIKIHSQKNFPDLLVLMLQTIGNNPFDELVEICKPITYGVIKRYFLPGYEQDDFLQEARTVLVQSMYSWKVEKGMPFLQYYHMQLSNHLNMLVRKNHAQKRYINLETSSLDHLVAEAGVHVQGTACATTHPEEMLILQETFNRYRADLSSLESEVFDRYIRGQSCEEISEALGITKDKVQNAVYRCRLKYKKTKN